MKFFKRTSPSKHMRNVADGKGEEMTRNEKNFVTDVKIGVATGVICCVIKFVSNWLENKLEEMENEETR